MLVTFVDDANDQLFPLAFTIVEGKNNGRWGWFMACIYVRVTQHLDFVRDIRSTQGILAVILDEHLG